MPKLYSAKELLKAFKRAGFYKVSQKGSHIKLRGILERKTSNGDSSEPQTNSLRDFPEHT